MQQTNAQVQFNYFNKEGFSLGLSGIYLRALDRSKNSFFNFRQYWMEIVLSYAKSSYSLLMTPSIGFEEELDKRKTRLLQRYTFNLHYSLSTSFSLNLTFEFGNIHLLKARLWRYTIGGQLNYQLSYRTNLSGFIQTNQYTLLGNWSNQYTLNFRHLFENSHQLVLNIQKIHHSNSKYCNETQFLVSYTIPFDMKLVQRRDQGAVSGRVYQRYTGKPISRALVCIDQQSILTDERGCFLFQGIPNGRHQFRTDKLLPNQVSPYSKPVYISVENGETTMIQVPVYQRSSLEGHVMLFDYQDLDQVQIFLEQSLQNQTVEILPVCVGGLEKISLKLQNCCDQETFYCESDSSGFFCFSHLYPGEWLLTVNNQTLPKGYKAKIFSELIQIQENQTHKIQLDIIPIDTREIHIEK